MSQEDVTKEAAVVSEHLRFENCNHSFARKNRLPKEINFLQTAIEIIKSVDVDEKEVIQIVTSAGYEFKIYLPPCWPFVAPMVYSPILGDEENLVEKSDYSPAMRLVNIISSVQANLFKRFNLL